MRVILSIVVAAGAVALLIALVWRESLFFFQRGRRDEAKRLIEADRSSPLFN